MIFQAVVVVFLVGTPSPVQFEAKSTSSSLRECFYTASVLLTNIVRTANRPVLSGQSFCLDVKGNKKKAMPPGNKTKENTGGPNI